jgi:hypothetical protein
MDAITVLLLSTSLVLVSSLLGASLLALYTRACSVQAETVTSTADENRPPEQQRWQRQRDQ